MADGYISQIKTPDNKTYLLRDSEKTDEKVSQASNSENKEFPIILKNTNNTTNETAGVKYAGGVTVNPSTEKITATNIQADSRLIASKAISQIITGTGTAASYTNSTYYPAKWTFNTGLTATDGDIFTIKIPVAGHDYGVFMSIDNGANYYPVVLNGTGRITTHYPVNTYLTVIFEPTGSAASMFAVAGQTSSTRITVTGGVWRVLNYYDSNSNDTGYYHRRIYPNLKAGGAIHPYSIIMQLPNGKWSGITTTAPNNPGKTNVSPVATGKTANTSGFMLGHVLLMYANTTYADTNNIGTYNIWSAHTGLIDARYSFNLANSTGNGFVAYTPVYIVGTISDGLFHLDTTKWWTQTLPSNDDGKVYIYIGDAYDWYRLTFTEDKPIYWYKNGAVGLYSGASEYAAIAPLSGISGADDLQAIEAISETTGLLKKTAANTWTLDTSNYVTSSGITSVTIGATSPVQSSTSTAQNGSSASTTISLKDAYGDTKNPYGTKAKNLVLAGPSSGSNAAPTFRALVAADIPDISGTYVKKVTSTDNAIVRFDGTTGAIQDSGVTINDNDHLIAPAIRIANTYYGVSFGRTTGTPKETILHTGIKWVSGAHMPVIHITGYAYGLQSPVEFKIGFYIYGNKIGWSGATNMGSWEPDIYLFKDTRSETNYVAVGLAGSCYFLQLSVDLQDEMGKFNNVIPTDWSWDFLTTEGTIPSTDDGTTCVKVPYKASIFGAKYASITTTSNAIAYYTNTTGTFSSKASANGALYATSANGALQWGTLPIAQGGTGATTAANARTNLGLGTMALETAANYLARSGGQMTGPLTWKDSTALPETTSGQYFLVIDAFANGGTTKWIGKANVLTSIGAAPSSHNHAASDINSGTLDLARIPTITNAKLANSKVIIAGNDVSLGGSLDASTLTSSLGLSSAMHYRGTSATIPPASGTYVSGDVLVKTDTDEEYVYDGTSWRLLGSESSYKIKQEAVADPTAASTTSTTFIDTISQNTNGVISATKKTLPTASTSVAGIIKIGSNATDALAGSTNVTNVAFTAATDNNEYPILLKNSTGSTTTAASAKFANTTNKMTTINPSTGMITAPSLTLASNAATAHLAFARAGWNYVTMPNNDSSVISIGYGTQADNTTQRLVIYKTGTVRPGANGSQNLGDDTHKWNKVYGVNFYGTFNGTATSAQQLAAREIDNSDLNQFSSGGALKYAWVSGGNNILSKPTDVNAFGVIVMKTAASWTGQLLMSTDSEPGLYWRTNLTTETPTYGAWAKVWDSSNHRVFYGTCAEAAGTATKPVVCTDYDEMKVGDIITVKFNNTNTAASPTLNVNGKGSTSIKMAYSGGTADISSYTQLTGIRTFIYDGTNWILQEGECVKQEVTDTTSDIWRPIMLGAYNSTDVRQAPEQRYAKLHAARNVKYHQTTGTLRAPILKTPKLLIEYSFEDKAHIEWNDTDSSIDFIFD